MTINEWNYNGGKQGYMNDNPQAIKSYESLSERDLRTTLVEKLISARIPKDQLLSNLGLFLDSKCLSRILFMDFLYQKIIDVQGVIMEFGTRWGQNLALLAALRGIYEPFNRHRKILGFDTFAGFPSIAPQDGTSEMMEPGQLAVSEGYDIFLSELLTIHEGLSPLGHIKKFDLRKGDATRELPCYLESAPETMVALAYFDFDLYEPTKKCLQIIRPRLTKGSVVGFDELNDPDSPGETLALMETFGLNQVRVKRFPHASRVSYFVVE
jgi:hypothetical protein